MKRTRLFLTFFGLVLSLFSAAADPLGNWYWRNPLPNGNPPFGPHTLFGIVYTNGQFFAVGAAGVVSVSNDGTNWTESLTATPNTLRSILYVNGQFVAVGDGGTVETSVNGLDWVLQNSGTTASLNSVAYGNGKYVAVGSSVVIASADAVSWSPAVSGISGASRVAGSSNGFVAVNNNPQTFFSVDGLTWTSQTLNRPRTPLEGGQPFNSLVTYTKGVYLIASFNYYSSESADCYTFSSSDGTNWTTNFVGNVFTGSSGFKYDFFMTANSYVIASGSGAFTFLLFSTNAVNWSLSNGVPYNVFQGANAGAFGNSNYVVMTPGSPPPIFTSTDGSNWVNQAHFPSPPVGPTSTFTSIAYSNGLYVVATLSTFVKSTNGLVYVVESNTPSLLTVITVTNGFLGVGSGGLIYQSGDGLSWTQRNSATLNTLHSVTAGGPLLVAVGDNGSIQTSPSGLVWTGRPSGTSLALVGVTCLNGVYVAVGQQGTVLTSPDGINWTGQFSGVLTTLESVTHGPTGFLAVGTGGTIITSPDGVDWTQQNSGTSATLDCATYGGGYYLATGDNATVLASFNGVNWTARDVGATGGQNFYGCAFLNGRFDVVGSNGTVLETDVIPLVMNLQINRSGVITVFATPGINFRIQSSPDLTTAGWTDVAAFTNSPGVTVWTNTVSGGQNYYRAVSP